MIYVLMNVRYYKLLASHSRYKQRTTWKQYSMTFNLPSGKYRQMSHESYIKIVGFIFCLQ